MAPAAMLPPPPKEEPPPGSSTLLGAPTGAPLLTFTTYKSMLPSKRLTSKARWVPSANRPGLKAWPCAETGTSAACTELVRASPRLTARIILISCCARKGFTWSERRARATARHRPGVHPGRIGPRPACNPRPTPYVPRPRPNWVPRGIQAAPRVTPGASRVGLRERHRRRGAGGDDAVALVPRITEGARHGRDLAAREGCREAELHPAEPHGGPDLTEAQGHAARGVSEDRLAAPGATDGAADVLREVLGQHPVVAGLEEARLGLAEGDGVAQPTADEEPAAAVRRLQPRGPTAGVAANLGEARPHREPEPAARGRLGQPVAVGALRRKHDLRRDAASAATVKGCSPKVYSPWGRSPSKRVPPRGSAAPHRWRPASTGRRGGPWGAGRRRPCIGRRGPGAPPHSWRGYP